MKIVNYKELVWKCFKKLHDAISKLSEEKTEEMKKTEDGKIRRFKEYQYKCLKCKNIISTLEKIGDWKLKCFNCGDSDFELVGEKKRSYKI